MEINANNIIQFRESEIEELVEDVRFRLQEFSSPINLKLDFEFIAKFIRVKKYNPESAAGAIQRYYKHIHRNLKRLTGIKPSDYAAIYDSQTLSLIKHKFQGTQIAYSRVKNWDYKNVALVDLVDSALLFTEQLLNDQEMQPYGNIGIVDLEGMGFGLLKHVSLQEMKHVVHMALDGVPARLTALHIINPPYLYWPLHRLVMKLIPEKQRKRIHVHADHASLHEYVDKNILPQSLGGPLDNEEAIDTEFVEKLLKNDVYYEDYWSAEAN